MQHLIGEHWEGDVRVRWWGDDVTHQVTIERTQDVESVIDQVQAANVDGVKSVDGMGLPIAEVPVMVAMKFCEDRGIPWEKFLYGRDYDDEFKRFCREYQKLAYRAAKKYH